MTQNENEHVNNKSFSYPVSFVFSSEHVTSLPSVCDVLIRESSGSFKRIAPLNRNIKKEDSMCTKKKRNISNGK